MGSISDLNDGPLSKKTLQPIFSNIRQKHSTIDKCNVSNLYKVVIDFSFSDARTILANNSFRVISFASNEDDQKNSISRTIYKSADQTCKTETNIEYKPEK